MNVNHWKKLIRCAIIASMLAACLDSESPSVPDAAHPPDAAGDAGADALAPDAGTADAGDAGDPWWWDDDCKPPGPPPAYPQCSEGLDYCGNPDPKCEIDAGVANTDAG